MVKRKKTVAAPAPAPAMPEAPEVHGEYEQIRLARMRENKLRMQQLGLTDLSHTIFKDSSAPKKKKPSSLPRIPRALAPARRSARLQSNPAPCYKEALERSGSGGERRSRRDGSRAGTGGEMPEIYTEEHAKLLGNAKEEWELFKDGFVNGVRIYDPSRGITCHQCRQKTLGQRTFCRGCQSLHGQVCGDCIYMRYGENVRETLADETWRCPVCRDICNCSICRIRKGWNPTGSLYRTALALGYKSVAHMLILSRMGKAVAAPEQVANPAEELPVSDQAPAEESSGSEQAIEAKRELEYDSCSKKDAGAGDAGDAQLVAARVPGAAEAKVSRDPQAATPVVISDSEEEDKPKASSKSRARVKRQRVQPGRAAKLK